MKDLEKMMECYQPDMQVLEAAMKADGETKMTGGEKERILHRALEKAGFQTELVTIGSTATARDEERPEKISQRNTKRHWQRKTVLLAACVAIFAMVGIGYAASELDTTFKAWFSPSTEEQLAMLESAGIAIGAEAESQGTVVRVREAIGDEGSVNLLIDLIAPEGTILDADYYTFYQPLVSVQNAHGLGYSFSELEKEGERGNVYTTILSLSSSEKLDGAKIRISLKGLCVYKDEDERKAKETGVVVADAVYIDDCYREVVPGEWDLDFVLNYKDTSIKVYPNLKVEKDGDEALVKELRVSPISLGIELQRGNWKDVVGYAFNRSSKSIFGGVSEDIKVTMKDGSVLEQSTAGSFSEGRTVKMDLQYGKIIDVKEIDSITFCGIELWKTK